MRTKRDLLELFLDVEAMNRGVTAGHLMEHVHLSRKNSVKRLTELWRDQLIRPEGNRPRGFRFTPAAGERIESLRFRITARGRDRLNFLRRREDGQEDPGIFD